MPRGLTTSRKKRSFPVGAKASVGRSSPSPVMVGVPRTFLGFRAGRGATEGVRGRVSSWAHGRQRRGPATHDASVHLPPGRSTARHGRSWESAVKHSTTRGRAFARKPGVVRSPRRVARPDVPFHGPHRASDESSRTRRSTGAREEGRLQKSVRSIFHVACEEDREVLRSAGGVAYSRRLSRDERGHPRVSDKGAEVFSAPARRPGELHPMPDSRSNPRTR